MVEKAEKEKAEWRRVDSNSYSRRIILNLKDWSPSVCVCVSTELLKEYAALHQRSSGWTCVPLPESRSHVVSDVSLIFGALCRFLKCSKAVLTCKPFFYYYYYYFDAISLVTKCRITTCFHRQLNKIRINLQEAEISAFIMYWISDKIYIYIYI